MCVLVPAVVLEVRTSLVVESLADAAGSTMVDESSRRRRSMQ